MLVELRVENLGIVDELSLEVPPGMVAITGETGAGKTIIVEAMAILVGGRAEPGMVRAGASEARVEGRFALGDEEHVLERVVPAEGRSRAYVDGRLATAGALTELGRDLVDLHGQHTHQSLLRPATQRGALDAYVGPEATRRREEHRGARAASRAAERELASLGGDDGIRAREMDLLRFQVDEIEAAEIEGPDEEDRLAAEAELLADAQAHREALARAREAVDGRAREAVGDALGALGDRAAFAETAKRLGAIAAELDDLATDLRGAAEAVDGDPARLDHIGARRARLQELRRKYGTTLADVLEHAAAARERLATLDASSERRDELLANRARHDAAAEEAAAHLHDLRVAAATPLAKAVTEHLRALALGHARFAVVVTEDEPGDDGADAVELRFAANPGEPLRPLAKVASGGELARIMLALRVVLTAGPPTLVFDEVDAGLGGAAGNAVGRLLARVARDHQVLCVTHLAQVAAFADAQVVVDKEVRDGRTVTRAQPVAGEGRVAELSRMLAGVGESHHAREHATELLEAARRR